MRSEPRLKNIDAIIFVVCMLAAMLVWEGLLEFLW